MTAQFSKTITVIINNNHKFINIPPLDLLSRPVMEYHQQQLLFLDTSEKATETTLKLFCSCKILGFI